MIETNKMDKESDEWYTPLELISSLGVFDLDPCAAMNPLWPTATTMYNKEQDGLKQLWEGRVWLNPPYSYPLIEEFIKKLSEHGNGIALIFSRCELKLFYEYVFPKATAVKFLRQRIRFFKPDGKPGLSPRHNSMFVAFGEENAACLQNNKLAGKYVRLN